MSAAADVKTRARRGFAMAPRLRTGLIGGLLLWVPVIVAALLLSQFAGVAVQRTFTLFLINLIAVLGFGVFIGNSGILSFGHVAFIGIGAYLSGILTIPVADIRHPPHTGRTASAPAAPCRCASRRSCRAVR